MRNKVATRVAYLRMTLVIFSLKEDAGFKERFFLRGPGADSRRRPVLILRGVAFAYDSLLVASLRRSSLRDGSYRRLAETSFQGAKGGTS